MNNVRSIFGFRSRVDEFSRMRADTQQKQVSNQSLPAFGEIFRLLPIAVIFLLIPAALAQEFRATVTGTVTDESGAQIAGARVEVKNLATGLTVNSVTNTDGSYITPFLEPGKYSITVTTSGFKLDFIHQAGIAESLGQVLE